MLTLNMKEVIPHIKLMVNSHVSLTQCHEGHYMKDPEGVWWLAQGRHAMATSEITGAKVY
jgi:hypothetical protein